LSARDHHVVVIGAGIGGLTSALLLACQGLRVTVLERAETPGGKMRQLIVNGAPIDSGPTVFTMRWILEHIFEAAGTTLGTVLNMTPLDVLARHAWSSPQTLDLFADVQRSADAIGAFSGSLEAKHFLEFCAEAKRVYNALEGPHIRSERPTITSLCMGLGPRGLAVLTRLGPFSTLWHTLARHFRDPRLQQLYGRYATYCGSSPFQAPATLMLIAQVEMDGVWSVDGGMHAVAKSIADLAKQRGAEIRYGVHCEEIIVSNGRAAGVRFKNGEVIHADSVIFNGDAAALALGLLGASASSAVKLMPTSARSLSAMTWSINAKTNGFPLSRHNVFFDEDYASEFRDIFEHKRLPRKATVYVCAQDRDAAKDKGKIINNTDRERLLCLVNAPAIGDERNFDAAEIEQCEQNMIRQLARCGLTINSQAHNTQVTTPQEFNRLFPGTGGALYGMASHGWMALFKRPSSTSRIPGLYLAGGSVHPGPGVPMAAMSGQLAAVTLMDHLDSTSRSRRVVISGGMSTQSATTGNMD
jgi:1-hydroxycarotenoid 3,4-desaturase